MEPYFSPWGIIYVNTQDIKPAGTAYRGIPKRLLDIVLSFLAIMLTALPMLVCALAIYIESGGPVIFRQWRMGADRRPFICFKFRTMTNDAPHSCATVALRSPERYITRVGAGLRASSLDELPQLFNVLRGDMSLIGPRPVICEEHELIGLRTSLGVYNIRPGMTGLAQVRGRDSVSIRRKAAYDTQYMEHMSLSLDARVLWRTLINVVNRSDIHEGSGTTENVGSAKSGTRIGTANSVESSEGMSDLECVGQTESEQNTVSADSADGGTAHG